MIRQDIIDRIISDVSILEVAENGGVSFTKKSRSRHWACCPFHNESGPSFYVDTALIRGAASDAILVAMSSLFTEN